MEVSELQVKQYISNSLDLKDVANNNHVSTEELIKDRELGYKTKTKYYYKNFGLHNL